MYDSDPAGELRSDVIRDGLNECAACVVAINIEPNVAQGVSFNTEN